jgi:hypothetical protein
MGANEADFRRGMDKMDAGHAGSVESPKQKVEERASSFKSSF